MARRLVREDPVRPTTPTRVRASLVAPTSLTLTWGAARDDRAVTAGEVYRDGKRIRRPHGQARRASLKPDRSYRYRVARSTRR